MTELAPDVNGIDAKILHKFGVELLILFRDKLFDVMYIFLIVNKLILVKLNYMVQFHQILKFPYK